jgi:hypothetical protein
MENETDTDKKDSKIKAYTLKQLAALYGFTVQTMRKWIAPLKDKIGPRIGHFYNPKQIKIIFEHLGNPSIWMAILYEWLSIKDNADANDHDHNHNHGHDHYTGGDDDDPGWRIRRWD